MLPRERAKVELKKKGWSYRRAAPHLGVCYTHLAYVLNGQRISRSLLRRVIDLPACKEGRS